MFLFFYTISFLVLLFFLFTSPSLLSSFLFLELRALFLLLAPYLTGIALLALLVASTIKAALFFGLFASLI